MKKIIALFVAGLWLLFGSAAQAHTSIQFYSVRPVLVEDMNPYHRSMQMAYQDQFMRYQLQRAYIQNQILQAQLEQAYYYPYAPHRMTEVVVYPARRGAAHARRLQHDAYSRARCHDNRCRR